MWRRLRWPRGHEARSWPLLLLLVVVIVPTIGVLWFMLVAMENERMAVRQRLATAYRTQLAVIKSQLLAALERQAAELDRRAAGVSCAVAFAAAVRAGDSDSLICTGVEPGAEYPADLPRQPAFQEDEDGRDPAAGPQSRAYGHLRAVCRGRAARGLASGARHGR